MFTPLYTLLGYNILNYSYREFYLIAYGQINCVYFFLQRFNNRNINHSNSYRNYTFHSESGPHHGENTCMRMHTAIPEPL